jgi:nitroimidazol reductase NimA-like FMN-containing flavoprotein (pyridoxamine 5'-phosphate oxidase superfamily)
MKRSERTKVRRVPARGNYDPETIRQILDAHFLCHVAFIQDDYPVVIPTLYGRKEDRLYLHGATSSRFINSLGKGISLSLSVTLVDGFVLARSAFHHSMNYRSVVLFGQGKLVPEDKKYDALKIISDHIIPGRWEEIREPNQKELKATNLLTIPIHEASAKIRTGPPKDDESDYQMDVWAGVVPLKICAFEPLADPRLKEGLAASGILDDLLKKYS